MIGTTSMVPSTRFTVRRTSVPLGPLMSFTASSKRIPTIKEITSNINQLYALGYPDEAIDYLKKFEKLDNIRDVMQMIELQDEIKQRIKEIKPNQIEKY